MSDDDPRPTIVVDASAALAMIRSEKLGLRISALIANHRSRAGRLLVPDHFWLEIVNVLIRRYAARPEETVDALRALDDLGIESIRSDRPQLLLVIDLQAVFGLTAYDAAYLALAESEDARLITSDSRLAGAAGPRAIAVDGLVPHRLGERAASYDAAPADWARFGPYLAQLRDDARRSSDRPTEAQRAPR